MSRFKRYAHSLLSGYVLLGLACSPHARQEQILRDEAIKRGVPRTIYEFPTPDMMPGAGPFHRAGWFRANWVQRRFQFWSQRASDEGTVVFVGDSITQGWEQLAAAFPEFHVANRGIAGDTSRGLIYRFEEDVLSLSPRAMVLLIGINDLLDQATPEIVEQNIRRLVALFGEKYPDRPIFICLVLPVGAERLEVNQRIQRLNAKLARLGSEKPAVVVCDTWKVLAGPDNSASRNDLPDLLHPNAGGYAKLASVLRPAMLNRLPQLSRQQNPFR